MEPSAVPLEAASARYGCDVFGRLETVLLHTPGKALEMINSNNHDQLLFDWVPDVQRFISEHRQYKKLLEVSGVHVLELSDYVFEHRDLIDRLPNLTYMCDTAVISRQGAMVSAMAFEARRGEETVVKEALQNLDIPIFSEFDDSFDAFEGCLLLSEDTILVAHTERHRKASIDKFVRKSLSSYREIIYVNIPRQRRFMHPDRIFSRIDHHLALIYLPAFLETRLITKDDEVRIDFSDYMRRKGIELVNVSNEEQKNFACSCIALEPGVIMQYDTAFDSATRRRLIKSGIEIIPFHADVLFAGTGSLRCLTLRVHRTAGC